MTTAAGGGARRRAADARPPRRRSRKGGARTKIYTRTGDDGTTSLFGGRRVPKTSPRVQAYGTLDELNAALGVCRVEIAALPGGAADLEAQLETVQGEIFALGAELATPSGRERLAVPPVEQAAVERLERWIDAHEEEVGALTTFILPGGSRAAAALHVARTVCRRAEREVVALAAEAPVAPEALRYLNRLSDLLFSMARVANRRAGVPDIPWQGSRRKEP
ncbi:MAG: cob(I)yrinic acid a,c-diamide adenosyltransferase [Firmicutes bacterium]|nr:cob(I)yrinic acid a,c-diamide adenosyltransferase [Bacillota bacterium]